VTKYVLKRAIEDRLPPHIYNKRKQGFGVPLKKWLSINNGENLKEVLLDPRTLNRGFFKKRSISEMLKVFIENKGDYYYPNPNGIVALITLELCQRYLCEKLYE
jgi:asparagine synthase (glutamine-hydrolysing)